MIPPNPNSIAIDPEPYVVVLARRVRYERCGGRRHAHARVEAREYLRTGRVPFQLPPLAAACLDFVDRPHHWQRSVIEMASPCPTDAEIDAIFVRSTNQKQKIQ